MNSQFLTFRRFNEAVLAKQLTDVLDENDIEYDVTQESLVANPLLVSGDELSMEYIIKLKQQDFDKVNELLVAGEEQAVSDVESDYYLYDFTDQELLDIVKNFDEWSAFDFALARKILKDRGVVINDRNIADFKQDKIDMLKQPEESQRFWIVLGYIFAFLGGLLGIFIGWYLATSKKTLPNGEQVYSYAEEDRKQGKNILTFGVIMLIVSVILRIYLVGKNGL
jgi:hypothetical protein